MSRRTEHDDRVNLLASVPLLAKLSSKSLQSLAQQVARKQFQHGDIVFSEGQGCDGLWIIEAGLVQLFKVDKDGREQVLATHGPGETLSERPIIDGGKHALHAPKEEVMASYTTSLVAHENVAHNTLAVHLAKPPGFTFCAGQYADVALVCSPFHDLWGNLRTFSMASAPFEDQLEFVMRISQTAFKRALSVAPSGTTVTLKGPAGNFYLDPDDTRPAVFLAGGVGIAPFLSILRQAEHDRSPRPFYLFYSNHELAESAYLNELYRHAAGPLKLELIPTITGEAAADWTGEKGRVDPAMLLRHIPAGTHPVYYIAGPSRFISIMASVLTALDVGEADIQVENFGEF